MKKLSFILVLALFAISLTAQSPKSFNYQAVVRNGSGTIVSNTSIGLRISILQGSVSGTAVCVEEFSSTTNDFGLVNLAIGSVNTVDFAAIDWSAGPYFIKVEVDVAGGTSYVETGTSQLLSVPYALHAQTADNVFSGDYNDLDNTPDFTGWDNNASDDFDGDYNSLSNPPDLGLKLDTASTDGWDKDKSDDFNGDYTSLGNAPNITDTVILVLDTTTQFLRSEVDGSVTNEIQTLLQVLTEGNSANAQIKNVTDPTDNQDAVTKVYVDAIEARLKKLERTMNAGGTVTDYDGNVYYTVKLGDQVWMTENLRTTKYNNGAAIDYPGTNNTAWGSNTTGAYAWYDNDEATYKETYGALYNWYAINTGNLCPTGWHVPTHAEVIILTDYLSNNGYGYGGSGTDIGKSVASTSNWVSSPTAGDIGNDMASNNSSGLSIPPGGVREVDGSFNFRRNYADLWTSTQASTLNAYCRYMYYTYNDVRTNNFDKNRGMSVRCIKD